MLSAHRLCVVRVVYKKCFLRTHYCSIFYFLCFSFHSQDALEASDNALQTIIVYKPTNLLGPARSVSWPYFLAEQFQDYGDPQPTHNRRDFDIVFAIVFVEYLGHGFVHRVRTSGAFLLSNNKPFFGGYKMG